MPFDLRQTMSLHRAFMAVIRSARAPQGGVQQFTPGETQQCIGSGSLAADAGYLDCYGGSFAARPCCLSLSGWMPAQQATHASPGYAVLDMPPAFTPPQQWWCLAVLNCGCAETPLYAAWSDAAPRAARNSHGEATVLTVPYRFSPVHSALPARLGLRAFRIEHRSSRLCLHSNLFHSDRRASHERIVQPICLHSNCPTGRPCQSSIRYVSP
jgi:hypothetical protein